MIRRELTKGKKSNDQMEIRRIELNPDNRVEFHNQVDFCVGTGRMGLAL